MEAEFWKLVETVVPKTYATQACNASKTREKSIRILLQHKKLPEHGWDDATTELLLQRLSLMDSNNFTTNCGMGEREARIASNLVAKRHYNFGHGIGRSGDLTEVQPKAAGSSLMYKLTNALLEDLFKVIGIQERVHCLLVPVATGMALVLSMLALRSLRGEAKYVIWSRIDQKSCFKSIITSGFIPIIVNTKQSGDELVTDTISIEDKIKELGDTNVLCVMSTTSCFAPRACDNIEEISMLCKKYEIPHLVNNAYGLQSPYIMKRIQKAKRKGRIDVFVQSADKNLMVPVGGAIIAGFNKEIIDNISKTYPGRASSAPLMDVFITLLSLGKIGYMKLLEQREFCFNLLKDKLWHLSCAFDERILVTEGNPISLAITLSKLPEESLTEFGSMLFVRNVSGTRVVSLKDEKIISSFHFKAWGSHCDDFKVPYVTCAASIGITEADVLVFIERLKKVFTKCYKKDEQLQQETKSVID